MKNKKIKVGGLALFNGIIFSSKYRQVIVQKSDEKIECSSIDYVKEKNIISKIPIIRGILGITSQVNNSSSKFIESIGEQDDGNKFQTIIVYILMIILCISIPVAISLLFKANFRNIIQFLGIAIEFILYLILLKNISQFNILFMYHGAEHKAVNAYEKLDLEDINLENVKKQSRFHKRCGGNFVVYLVILTLASVFIPIGNLFFKAIIMMLCCILNIGLAYEIVEIFSKIPKPFDIINYPGTLIQFITTKEPTDDMLRLAIYGVLGAVREKNGIILTEYVKKYITENLKDKEYDTQDIYSIIEYVTKIDRNKLLIQKDSYLITLNNEIKIDRLLNRYYIDKYPLQYLTHKQYFWNEVYYVDENVLIPRADSEILVEKAIEYINNEEIKNVIDLCTGSGALGISIAKNTNIESMELIDISIGAIGVAKKNIKLNGVEDKIITRISDLLSEKIKYIESFNNSEEGKVEMIVSNPPYIRSDVVLTLQEEVKKEPHLALDGGKTGLDFYIRIFKEAKKVLKNNGLLILEIGYDQLDDIKELIKENNEFKLLESVKDYGGNDRVVVCRFQDK